MSHETTRLLATGRRLSRKIAAEPEFQRTLIASGFDPVLDSGQRRRAFITAKLARWIPVIKATDFKMQQSLRSFLRMQALVPGIHVFIPSRLKDVDGRDKLGYDG